jgi:Zn-dependent protease
MGTCKRGGSVHVATAFGIPIRVHWSYVALIAGMLIYGQINHGIPIVGPAGFLAVAMSISVVLHELGHAMAARRFGIGTESITLYPMGGIASIERMPEEPDQELVIALAGPAVNFLLAGLGGLFWSTHHPAIVGFVLSNLIMGVFNLLPAFPMDGGRVLRALLAKWMGWLPASRMAVRIGRVFAWLFIVGPIAAWASGYGVSVTLPLIGVFLHVALNSEKERLVALHWERTTGRPPPWVGAGAWAASPGILVGSGR